MKLFNTFINLFLLFFTLSVFSQNIEIKIDSLKKEINNPNNLNRALFDIYHEEAIQASKTNLQLAKQNSFASLSLARDLNNDTLLAKSFQTLGIFYRMENKVDSSILFIKLAKEKHVKLSNIKNELVMNSLLTSSYAQLFKFDSAFAYLNESEKIYNQNDSLKNNLYVFFKIQKGNFFYKLKLYHYALKEYYEAQYFSEKQNCTELNASIIGGIGVIYATTSNYHKAINFYKSALPKFEEYDIDKAIILKNLGNNYAKLHHIDSALYFYKESIRIYKSKNVDINTIYQVYLDIYQNINPLNIDTALYYFNLIDPNFLNSQIKPLYIFAKSNITDNDKEKLSFLTEISNNYFHNIDIELQSKVYFDLYTIYLAQNNHYLALQNYSKYVDLKDSIYNHEKTLALHNVIVDNVIKKNSITLETQKLEFELIKKQKNIWITILILSTIVFILLGVITYFSLKSQKQKNIIIENKNKLLYLKSKEIKQDIINLSLELDKSNTFISNLEIELKNLRNQTEHDAKVGSLYSLTKQFLMEEENKKSFNEKINAIKNDFFIKLDNNAQITKTEKKLAALLKLNMSSKEIASILNVSEKSIEIYRTRLRKKLHIPHEISLPDYFNSL